MKTLDCSGLACPEPVLRTKELLDSLSEGVVTVIVDNAAARENVARFARNQGCEARVKDMGEGRFELTLVKGLACSPPNPASEGGGDLPCAILLLSDRVGADQVLGGLLVRAFFAAMTKASVPPARIIFLNSSVKLTSEGSEVLEELSAIAARGTELLSCGTCLDFFGKKEQLKAGAVTNMFDTVETLTHGYRVVTIS